MKHFIALIDLDEDNGTYGVEFPDAPGCTAMGESEDEVIQNATEALTEWAADVLSDGLELPEPRSYLQLHQSRRYGLGQGGMIARIPLIIETGKVIRANISIDQGLLIDIDSQAKLEGITRSAFLASAARDRIYKRA